MSVSMIEALPREILHEIHWWSFNPEFYFVSKAINSMLPSARAFEEDVMMLLFCRNDGPGAAWHEACLSWRTRLGKQYNLKLSSRERVELQQLMLTQQWFTMAKLKHAASIACETWVKTHWHATMTRREQRKLSAYLNPESRHFLAEGVPEMYDGHSSTLHVGPKTHMAIRAGRESELKKRMPVFEICYIPSKLLTGTRTKAKFEFLCLIFSFIPFQSYEPELLDCSFCQPAFRSALTSVISVDDRPWFAELLYMIQQNVAAETLYHGLIKDACSTAINHAKWGIMRLIIEGVPLPHGFLGDSLRPALAQAINEGDASAAILQQQIEGDGWAVLQARQWALH